MQTRRPTLFVLFLLALFVARSDLRADRLSPELLWKLGRLGASAVSPDGMHVAYTVRRYDLAENSGKSSLEIVPTAGGSPRTLAADLPSAGDIAWVATTNGTAIYLLAKRDAEEKPQVWRVDPRSGAFAAVTEVEGGVSGFKMSSNGARIAYSASVSMDPSLADLHPDLPKADARIIDGLLYRHWDHWADGSYRHLHVAKIGEDGKAVDAVDVMAGLRYDCPVPPFAGSEHFNWSPDGTELAFTSKMVARPAESTDTDLYLVDVTKPPRLRCFTAGRDGYDVEPSYSPDGSVIAFHSMARAGFESDRNRILLYNRQHGTITELTTGLDRTTHEATWSPDGKRVYFSSEDRGTHQIFSLDVRSARLKQVTTGRFNWSLRGVTPDGSALVAARQSMLRPSELYHVPVDGSEPVKLTAINDSVYASLELPKIEERFVRSSDGAKVHNWVIYPPDFDPAKKWPLLTYCQGGPQGQIGQWFSYRWNFHLMAAKGYVVLAVNRRGMPGFGRAWNDQISGDWGGQAMQDILAATDSMLTEPYVDARRVGAVGASFGGYTVYWLMGHDEGRFAAMIAHCGVFNLESMYGSTEELFFVNWDLGGPYWKSAALRERYDRFSPHRFVGRWKTPLLVIHGENDFRVPVTQGIEAFTAAQVEGVPSRFLHFPNEGHWVLSPQNAVLWQRVFFDWLARYCK